MATYQTEGRRISRIIRMPETCEYSTWRWWQYDRPRQMRRASARSTFAGHQSAPCVDRHGLSPLLPKVSSHAVCENVARG